MRFIDELCPNVSKAAVEMSKKQMMLCRKPHTHVHAIILRDVSDLHE